MDVDMIVEGRHSIELETQMVGHEVPTNPHHQAVPQPCCIQRSAIHALIHQVISFTS